MQADSRRGGGPVNPALHDSKSVGLFQFSIPSTVLAEEMIKFEFILDPKNQFHMNLLLKFAQYTK